MTRPTISTVPVPPARAAGAAAFSPAMTTFMSAASTFASETQALGVWAETQLPTKAGFIAALSADWYPTGAALDGWSATNWVGGTAAFGTVYFENVECYSAGVFAAPAAGLYLFGFAAQLTGGSAGVGSAKCGLYDVTDGVYRATCEDAFQASASKNIAMTAAISLSAGDQVRLDVIHMYKDGADYTKLGAGAQFWGRRLA